MKKTKKKKTRETEGGETGKRIVVEARGGGRRESEEAVPFAKGDLL